MGDLPMRWLFQMLQISFKNTDQWTSGDWLGLPAQQKKNSSAKYQKKIPPGVRHNIHYCSFRTFQISLPNFILAWGCFGAIRSVILIRPWERETLVKTSTRKFSLCQIELCPNMLRELYKWVDRIYFSDVATLCFSAFCLRVVQHFLQGVTDHSCVR